MMFALAGAAIGAGLNYLSAQEEQSNVDRQRQELESTKISSGERGRMMRDLDRSFNANISTSMNQMALTTRGTDASLATAAALGQAEGSRIEAKSDLYSNITSINRGIQTQIAGMSDVNMTSATISGGFEGMQMGMQAESLLSEIPSTDDIAKYADNFQDVSDPNFMSSASDQFTTDRVDPTSVQKSIERVKGIETDKSTITRSGEADIFKGFDYDNYDTSIDNIPAIEPAGPESFVKGDNIMGQFGQPDTFGGYTGDELFGKESIYDKFSFLAEPTDKTSVYTGARSDSSGINEWFESQYQEMGDIGKGVLGWLTGSGRSNRNPRGQSWILGGGQ